MPSTLDARVLAGGSSSLHPRCRGHWPAFGDQILSPPATPLVVVWPEGEVIEKHIGIKSAADLAAVLEEHLP